MKSLSARWLVLLTIPLVLVAPGAAAQVDTQLAGDSLASYPYFEYSRP